MPGCPGAPHRRRGRVFRQSNAQHSTPLIRRVAGELGYPVCLSYDVDSRDWTDPGQPPSAARSRPPRGGSIVRMHFGHQGTVTALPAVPADLSARGLAPVTTGTLLHT